MTIQRPDAPSPSGTAFDDAAVVEALNSQCVCIALDSTALRAALETELGQPGLSALVQERCPYLFAARPVFIRESHMQAMDEVVRAVESVAALPAYRAQVLAQAPAAARYDPGGARSVFFGYDFHLVSDGPQLIEINTNAGGAMLNAVLARAQRACCTPIQPLVPDVASAQALEQRIVEMFSAEWEASGRRGALRRIAIVDEAPQQQYLYPEFVLFQRLFERQGWRAVIADPSELQWRDGALWHESGVVDLVYNRLTDFALEKPEHAALLQAYAAQAVLLTPHPQAHALFADKRNLALFSDAEQLRSLGVPEDTLQILLRNIPRTERVTLAAAQRLWDERRGLFFKPAAGFGSRAAYRGDKLTKRVWQEILAGDYVAQAIVAPGERTAGHDDPGAMLKFDLRAYVYNGDIQWVAARLYQGQTTNFRTPGGGFAPVYSAARSGIAL